MEVLLLLIILRCIAEVIYKPRLDVFHSRGKWVVLLWYNKHIFFDADRTWVKVIEL